MTAFVGIGDRIHRNMHIPPENVINLDFIEAATIKPGTPFVTRPAPGIDLNPGGGIEVVLPKDGVQMRVSKYADGDKNQQICRFDLLPAYAALNPFLAGLGYGRT